MQTDDLWFAVPALCWLLFLLWLWRRFDVSQLSVTYDSAPAEEPCWTEEVRREDGLSYGRYGCYHADLAEMEARARVGEFST